MEIVKFKVGKIRIENILFKFNNSIILIKIKKKL